MRHLFLILAISCSSLSTYAQTKFLPSAPEAKRASEGIVASISSGNFPGAWKELRPLSVVSSSELDVFEAQFNGQIEGIYRRFGSPLGYEFISEQVLGNSLVRYQFLIRNEKAPVRWVFVFYRADQGWVLTDFKFDTVASEFFR